MILFDGYLIDNVMKHTGSFKNMALSGFLINILFDGMVTSSLSVSLMIEVSE